tara:strand:- start:152 stop:421 length:270 start_codon:yes stop_codon:yes gene_type:complete
MTAKQTAELAKKFGGDEKNTGKAEVQISILTSRIRSLTEHMKVNKKDKHSRKGLTDLVSKRRRLLKYLMKKNLRRYTDVINELKIRNIS